MTRPLLNVHNWRDEMDKASSSWREFVRISTVGLVLIFCTVWFCFLYSVGKVEIVYSYLYYIPIVVAAFFYGIPGGFVVAVFTAVAYSIFVSASGIPFTLAEIFPGIGSFIVIGLLTGLLSTHLVRSRKELADEVLHLTMVTDAGLAVTSTLHVKEVLEIITEKIVQALSCEVGAILLLDPQSKVLTIEAFHGIGREMAERTKLKMGEGISGWVAQHEEQVLVDDVDKDPRFAKRSSERYYTGSLLSVALKARGEVLGVLNVNKKERGEVFSKEDLNLLNGLAPQASVAIHNARLYDRVNKTYMNSMRALALAIDEKDHYTRTHSENVTAYAVAIAREMNLSGNEVEEIGQASQLHDLGKIGVHDYILNKPGKLTEEEWEEIKLHSLKGAEILEPLDFLKGVIELVKQHHERYDGKGYPNGQSGKNIRLGARIMAVADAYDAMISERPYRKALSKDEAINELKRQTVLS